jgi:hypothetical protein
MNKPSLVWEIKKTLPGYRTYFTDKQIALLTFFLNVDLSGFRARRLICSNPFNIQIKYSSQQK